MLNEAYAYAKPSSFSRGMRIDLNGVVILLISGTASIDENGVSVHIGDFRAQMRRTFDNITGLLESEGCTWHDIVRTSCYLRDIDRDYDAFNEERTAFFKEQGLDPLPASTGIQAHLCRPELLVEIEAIAMFRTDKGRPPARSSCHAQGMVVGCGLCCWQVASPRVALRHRRQARHVCECGAHPPGPPQDRAVAALCGRAADLSPYAKFAAPYDLNYTHPNIYSGAGRDIPDPKNLTEVRIGFFGPIEHNPDQVFGLRMLHGAQLAVEEANARGGYGGKPFRLMLHNDYDNWQAKAVYGDDRPTDPAIWGSASNEAVKMIYDDQDWAIFGSISSESTHIISARGSAAPKFRLSTRHRPIPRFPRPTFPGTSPTCRTTACSASRWRAASLPSWA